MQWLVALETEHDPICACRLMNVFRRKGMKIDTLALATGDKGYSIMAVVQTPESEIEHLFNFLRRTEGVLHVSCYRHEPLENASFVFIDSSAESSIAGRILDAFPESKLIFASQGKYLLEIPAECRPKPTALDEVGILSFVPVKTTRGAASMELVAA